MQIVIEVDDRPEGFLSVDGGPAVAIAGWTDLLVALGEILSPPRLSSGDRHAVESTPFDG